MPNSAISEIQARYIPDRVPDAAMYPPGSLPGSASAEFIYRAGFVLTYRRDQDRVLAAPATLGPEHSADGTVLLRANRTGSRYRDSVASGWHSRQ